MKYIDEVKPIADKLYYEKNYEDAVHFYQMIYETLGIDRSDVLLKMAQCYVYCIDIENAEKFFKLATTGKHDKPYLWAKYSTALSSQRKFMHRAQECAYEAEDIYNKSNHKYKWELAEIKYAQARVHRYSNVDKALLLYKEACDLDNTKVLYYCVYAQTLINKGVWDDAIAAYETAKRINPNYRFLIQIEKQIEVRKVIHENQEADLIIELDLSESDIEKNSEDSEEIKEDTHSVLA